jgi:hypothetical protein
MRFFKIFLLSVAMLFGVTVGGFAFADRGGHGGGSHGSGLHSGGSHGGGSHGGGFHGGGFRGGHFNGGNFRGGVFIGAPLFWPWYYSDPYFYPPYYYGDYPPVVSSPTVYVEQGVAPAAPEQSADWYYCARPKGYYPYVQQCPSGWQRVAPQPPPVQ